MSGALWAALGGALAAAAAVRRRWTTAVVRGHSMAPTLRDGQRVLVRRTTPVHGDVVVFLAGGGAAPAYRVKRVVAVGGDPVPRWLQPATAHEVVPPGHFVVRGDGRSEDSRQLGLVPAARVVGVVPAQLGARGRSSGA